LIAEKEQQVWEQRQAMIIRQAVTQAVEAASIRQNERLVPLLEELVKENPNKEEARRRLEALRGGMSRVP